jgi:hypothetical protein
MNVNLATGRERLARAAKTRLKNFCCHAVRLRYNRFPELRTSWLIPPHYVRLEARCGSSAFCRRAG